LVVFQFAASIALMLCAFTVYRQLEYAQKQSPGLQREHVLVIKNARNLGTETARESFRQQINQMPEALGATHSMFLPSLGSFGDFYEPEQGAQNRPVTPNLPISSFLTDEHFAPTLGVEILAGRNFQADAGKLDSTSVILNETAVKTIGWEDPVGKWIRYPGNANQRFQVVGIMRDFHRASVRWSIEPMALFHKSSKTYQVRSAYIAVRLRPGSEKTAIEKTAALWRAVAAGAPFEYDFLDASFARLYSAEVQTASVLGVFTGLALFIGCLGLFALAAFTAEQRTKEIGIRKALGASVSSVVGLLSKDFLKLVFIGLLIASPLAYWAMNRWLANFVYRTEVSGWMFAAVGAAVALIAFLTVAGQALKAAVADPVKSLRSE
jgi:putative ABC transport system permease protein